MKNMNTSRMSLEEQRATIEQEIETTTILSTVVSLLQATVQKVESLHNTVEQTNNDLVNNRE